MTDSYKSIRDALAMGPSSGLWEAWDIDRAPFITANGKTICYLYTDLSSFESWAIGSWLEALPNAKANASFIVACNPDAARKLLAERDQLATALEEAQMGLRYAVRTWVLSDEIAWSKEEIDKVVESIISDAKRRQVMADRYERIRAALAKENSND